MYKKIQVIWIIFTNFFFLKIKVSWQIVYFTSKMTKKYFSDFEHFFWVENFFYSFFINIFKISDLFSIFFKKKNTNFKKLDFGIFEKKIESWQIVHDLNLIFAMAETRSLRKLIESEIDCLQLP